MPKDHRLNLGRYVSNPFNEAGQLYKKLNFSELFRSRPTTDEYPWNPSRFDKEDLTRRMKTRKVTLNPDLGHVGNTPFFDEETGLSQGFEVFQGLGRFNRRNDYDFDEGRARTGVRPQQQPDFDEMWYQAYSLSPTIKAGDRAENPMPSFRRPDPMGNIAAEAERRAEREFEGDKNVTELLAEGAPTGAKREGEEVEAKEQEDRGEKVAE